MTNQTTSKADPKQPAPTTRKAKSQETKPANAEPPANSDPTPTSQVLIMLSRPEGATLRRMVEATGWLPHTTRASLTGLKKKGHEVTSVKADGVRTYRVAPVQPE